MVEFAGYIPALDGLRALAILLVLLSHLGLGRVLPGGFGVTLFFFISGMLITGQLRGALERDGRIGLGWFYLRRVLRLLPAALAYLAVAGGAFMLAGGRIGLGGWAAALLYCANYHALWGGYVSDLAGVRHPFSILWSLAIEEQFYLVWPCVLAGLWRRRAAWAVLLGVCAAVLLWRWFLFDACGAAARPLVCGPLPANPAWRWDRLYLATDARIDSLAWGAVLAAWPGRGVVGRFGTWGNRRWVVAASLGVLLGSFVLPGAFGRFVLRPTAQGMALLVLVPAALRAEGRVGTALRHKAALLVGRLSYSLYLWGWGALGVADLVAARSSPAWVIVATALTVGLSCASYWGIEQPMLRVRRWAGSNAARRGGTTPAGELTEPVAALCSDDLS